MRKTVSWLATSTVLGLPCGIHAQTQDKAADEPQTQAQAQALDAVVITSKALGKGEARANSVISSTTIQEQPAGQDPLKLVSRVPGLLVSSSDSLTGSFSMRLQMRGFNKEQIGVSVDGIPLGSTLSNGGTLPNRLLDPSNLGWVEVLQTSGDIGTPSNQALGGFIDFKTRDPSRTAGGVAEVSAGGYGFRRQFFRYDTGEFAGGTRAFVSAGHNEVRTWPNAQSGTSRRDHFDLGTLTELGQGNRLRWTLSYNNMKDNDYDAVALRSASNFKAAFERNPDTDGLTDAWAGNPAIDQNNRRTRGIGARDLFTHLQGSFKLSDTAKLEVKPYFHHQEGEGYFYVPYKQVPANGQVYSAVPAGTKTPVATVQECFANQYQRDAGGNLVPVSAVTFPAGVTAATLSGLGCPAAGRFAMNPQNQWGAREATTRLGLTSMNRKGVLSEVSDTFFETHRMRLGAWWEHIERSKVRNWYLASDPAVDASYSDAALYSTTQDRRYNSNTVMFYAQDKIKLLDDRAELDLGVTTQHFSETYSSPVEFNGTRSLAVKSNLLPKVAALYRLTDDLEVYTSGSKNFSALPDSVFEGTSAIDGQGVKPETATSLDAGIRWTNGADGLSFQLYRINYNNRISIQNGNPNGDIFSRDATTVFRNLGGIKSQGFEVTGRTTFGSIDLYGNYAFNQSRYVADTAAEGIRAGDPVLGAPKNVAYLEAGWKPSDSWRLTGNVKYVGKSAGTFHEYANTLAASGGPAFYDREYLPSYALVGLSGGYTLPAGLLGNLKKVQVLFNVDNLFDKRYLGGVGAELTTSNPLTSGRYFLGSPRTFYLTLRAEI